MCRADDRQEDGLETKKEVPARMEIIHGENTVTERHAGTARGARFLLPLLVIALPAFIFFSPFFLHGEAFLAADNLYIYYPWKFFSSQFFLPKNTLILDPVNEFYAENYNRQLRDGRLSQWNPYILAGLPSTGSPSMGHPGPYYPLKVLLHKSFPTHTALTLLLFIHIVLMGYFMYLYLLEIGAGWRGALFGAIAYMFNGCAMVWLEFELWVTVSAYLPLVLLFMERYPGKDGLRYGFGGGIVVGLMLLTGSVQLNVYAGLMISCYLMFVIARAYLSGYGKAGAGHILLGFAITVAVGALIGSVELFPFIESAVNSSRIHTAMDFHELFTTLGRVPFRYFITLFFPDYFGNPVLNFDLIPALPSQRYMNYNELSLYVGVSSVFAFVACVASRKNSISRFFLFVTLLVAAMMTGTYAYYPFFKLVPGMDSMNPTRLIFLFVFAFSVTAGLGVKGLENLTATRRNLFLGISLLVLAGVSFIAVYSNSRDVIAWFNREQFSSSFPNAGVTDILVRLRSITSPMIYKPLVMMFSAFFLFLLLVFIKKKEVAHVVFALLLTLLCYDLISFGTTYNTTVRPADIYPKTPAIEFLLQQPRPFRVVQDSAHGLFVNMLVPFELEEIGGYTSLYPYRTNRLMSYVRLGGKMFGGIYLGRWVMFEDFSSRYFDLMNVRYVLTAPQYNLPFPKYRLVFRGDLSVYENTQAMPRAYIVHRRTVMKDLNRMFEYMGSDSFDMRNEVVLEEEPTSDFLRGVRFPMSPSGVTIRKYLPDEIQLEAELSANGWLVLSNTYYPGWKAIVDGREVPILRANCNFDAIELHAGKHAIVFTYTSNSFRLGLLLSVVGVVSAVGGQIIVAKAQKKRSLSLGSP